MLDLKVARQAMEIGQNGDGCPLCGGADASPVLTAPDRFHGRRQDYQLARCHSCSCVWLVEPPCLDEMRLHYDNDYHQAIVGAGETDAIRRWQRHRDLISQEKQGGAILDIGCSSGAFLNTLNSRAWDRYGIEMEAATAEAARAKTGAEIFVGDVVGAPFPDEYFDVITCFDVLEHVYDPLEFLVTVHRWLKPGGIFCAALPNIDSWESRLFRSYWYGLELPRHLFHFSPTSLRYITARLGFKELHFATPNSYVERSVGYLYFETIRKFRVSARPPCKPQRSSLAWRVIRKLLRLGFVHPFAKLASAAGAGAGMEVVFAKQDAPAGASPAGLNSPK